MLSYPYLNFDLCAYLSMVTLVLALIVRKLTVGHTNRRFLGICVCILLASQLDIITESLDSASGLTDYYTMLRWLLDTLFFIAFNACAPLYFRYICSIMGLDSRIEKKKLFFHMAALPFIADCVLLVVNCFNGCVFYFDENLKYCHGSCFFILYIVAFYYFIFSMAIMIAYHRLLSTARFIALFICFPFLIVSVFIQVAFPYYRIELFFEAVFAIVIAITVHRPEDMVDSIIGIQSHNAFLQFVKTNFQAENSKCYLFVKIDDYDDTRSTIALDDYLEIISILAGKFSNICKAMTKGAEQFYLEHGAFAISSELSQYEMMLDAGRTILAYLNEPMKLRRNEVRLNARVCIVRCPDDINDENLLLNFASSFHNKIPDENRIIILSQIASSKDFKIRNEIDDIIRRGVDKQSFEMYYQPIYSIKDKKFVSAEALIRLKDKTYGFISPSVFIPAAEESGAIHDIGDFVIDDVCRFIGSSDFKELGLEYIELNLSVAQLIEDKLVEKIISSMDKYGVLPEQINLEITETAADYDPKVTDAAISRLRDAGLTFSLDDYGTGYSNVVRVASLPVDIVKLDKSLVDEMDTPLMWIVIRNTVEMLKHMEKKILVEGIEDERALKRFTEIGCDYIQGFYFSKPLCAKDYIEFVKQNNQKTDLSEVG